jgi:hypothetical protein
VYAEIVEESSFWIELVEIDRKFQSVVRATPCQHCGGPLHVADYPRKPRDVPECLAEAFSSRFSTCCGHCRKRTTPLSVRFLGRRVYAGIIVVLASMRALVCGASRQTLSRWRGWWTVVVPQLAFWRALQALLVPAVPVARLPASLLERFEADGAQTANGLYAALRALTPLTTSSCTLGEGACGGGAVAQKLVVESKSRGLLERARAPTTFE